MKEIIITYILIVIIQLLFTILLPIELSKETLETNKNVIHSYEKQDEMTKFVKEKIKIIMEKQDEMSYNEWIKFVKNNSLYEFNGSKFYIFVWKYDGVDEMILEVYPDKRYEGLSWYNFYIHFNQLILDSEHSVSENVPMTMFNDSEVDRYNNLTYYWIDGLNKQSVKKKSIYTRFNFEKEHKTGIIGLGFVIKNESAVNEYKYFNYIGKVELFIGSLITLVISLVISKLHTVKNANLKAFIFLLFSNLFIFFFNNTQGHISKVVDENMNITSINANILNLSFLSSINLFILSTMYSSNKDLFIETSVIFSMTVLLLMIASYKNTNQNSIFDLIKARITNTFIFDFAVALNLIIMINFVTYVFSKSFK